MKKKKTKARDYDFRPASYWEHESALAEILSKVKGVRRRRMIEEFVAAKVQDVTDDEEVVTVLGELGPEFVGGSLSDEHRIGLGHLHPSFMGGEYLPDYTEGGVEIARITLDSTTCDVYSVRAHRKEQKIWYSMCDEYESEYWVDPEWSFFPLTLRELISLIDTNECSSDDGDGDFLDRYLSYMDADDAEGFISFSSDFYPELASHYWEEEARVIRELREGAGTEGTEVDAPSEVPKGQSGRVPGVDWERPMSPQDYDYDFRPSSYWEHDNPLAAILCNIKGANRREMIEDIVTGRVADMTDNTAILAALKEVEPGLLEDSLSSEDRVGLGQIHPSFMGGEYLPDYLPGEIEIARVTLASVTRDVYSIRARRRARGICYSVRDEYDMNFWHGRRSSKRPLTFRQLIDLIDTLDSGDDHGPLDFVEAFWSYQDPDEIPGFITLSSDFYPELRGYYKEKEDRWLQDRIVWYRGENPLWVDGDEADEMYPGGSYEFSVLSDRVAATESVEELRKLLSEMEVVTAGVWLAVAANAAHFEPSVLDRVIGTPEGREALYSNDRLSDDDWIRIVFLALKFTMVSSGYGEKRVFEEFVAELKATGRLDKYQPQAEVRFPELKELFEEAERRKKQQWEGMRRRWRRR